MTRRLYYDDARRLEFASRVVEVRDLDQGRLGIVLEETCFYPTSGGQMHDRGRLGDLEVEEVVDDGALVLHIVRGVAPAPGTTLAGRIDGTRRAHHRQQHSGQHVLSRVLAEHYGWSTLSSRLGEGMNTIEIGAPELAPETLDEIEDRANRVIWDGRPVRVHYVDPEDAASAGLRKHVDRDGPLRVIEIEGHDRCPCGGTHVDNTAQIGLVAITGTEKVRQGTRILFLCGERAVHWRRERVAWLDRTARQLTTGLERVPATVARLQDEARERRQRMEGMAAALVQARTADWRAAAEEFGRFGAVLRALDADEELAAIPAIHAIVEAASLVAVLVIEQPGKRQVLAAAAASTRVDAGALLRRVLAGFGGKGGGQPGFARGGCGEVSTTVLLDAFRDALRSEAEDRR